VFYIFCEGKSREYEYFRYFRELSSKIQLIIIPPKNGETSPSKLYEAACKYLIKSENNQFTEYEVADIDDVWFVIDTDEWKDKIEKLRGNCTKNDWFVAQSNPCFEVWLFYHHFEYEPYLENIRISKDWKKFVNTKISGGFDSRKHPIYVKRAIDNAKNHYSETNGKVEIACTEVFKLAERFYPFIQHSIEKELQKNFL
jgi:hypothetical protein